MKPHVFLTGEKGVGKSTIICRLLDECKESVGGFLTVKTNEVYNGCYSVHLLSVAEEEKPSEGNLLFFCGAPADNEKDSRFNRLGCKVLAKCNKAGLIVMDELGPNEGEAVEFCQAVRNILEGDIPVIGVLQKADSEFLRLVANHPKVKVIEVTTENRDDVLLRLKKSWID